MLAIRNPRRTRTRRGAILLVVLAMLALFAVVALSFVLYAESEATSMRNGRAARNGEADPNPQEAANQFLGVLIYDTNDNTVAMYGHGLGTTKYGQVPGQMYSPHAGIGLPAEDVSGAIGLPPGSLNRTGVVNYTVNAAGQFVTPNTLTVGGTPFNKSTPYTYPDRANFYLAMQNPLNGEIIQPSFHRPDLFGSLNPTTNNLDPQYNPNWDNATGRYLLVRPRSGPGRDHPNFPLVPANADGTFTGDVQNMKFIAGASQKNDSLWMYAGSPVKTWRNKRYVAMVAPLVLDLNGRVNMSVAGNNRNAGASASNQGFGAWEVNPAQLGITAPELRGIVAQRYSGSQVFPPDPFPPANRYSGSIIGTINRGTVPPQYSRIDADGVGSGAIDPMFPAAAGNYNPFLGFTPRFADTQANFNLELADHPQTFNPFHWPRGIQSPAAPHALGMDDLVKLAGRYSDPKNRYVGTELAQLAPTSFANAPIRAMTTNFNVTQSWGEVSILTNGGSAKLGPVDLNRPLPDYRLTVTNNYHPQNMGNMVAARASRQALAMDIFLRLAALVPGLIDGTVVMYNSTTHSLNNLDPTVVPPATIATLRRLAQYAANIVDVRDSDDISTTFVWNALSPTAGVDPNTDPLNFNPAQLGSRVVYGTELPRLVVNEAYGQLGNDRRDPVAAPLPPGSQKANRPLQRKFWVELHNPLPFDGARPELASGAARLQWKQNESPDQSGNANAYTGTTFAVYRLDVLEAAKGQSTAYSAGLTNEANVTGDPAGVNGTAIPNLSRKIELNQFLDDRTPAPPAMPAAATIVAPNLDDFNTVKPAPTGATPNGPGGGNVGYYVVGPKDDFPAGGVNTTLRTADPPPLPASPVASMSYFATSVTPNQASITAEKETTNTVVLRRLANPYLRPNDPTITTAPFAYDVTLPDNPYVTVDYIEAVPVRDRVTHDDVPRVAPLADPSKDLPTIGRKHAYAAFPTYGAATPLVIDQVKAGVTPPHTFFESNTSYNNAAYIHYDRELINSLELLHVSAHAPHSLTAKFSDGIAFQRHNGSSLTCMSALMFNTTFPAPGSGVNLFKAFDLLTTANRMPAIPLGGREPGKVNLNTVGDYRTLRALLDPQQGNQPTFDLPWVDAAWTNRVEAMRSPNWATAQKIRSTVDEGGTDHPYKFAAGGNYEDAYFRSTLPQPAGVAYPFPMLFNAQPGVTHPYVVDEEPHRKAWNNLTTVSDGFLVIWTVGFFEVDSPVGAPVLQFGKELFDKVPGDLRAQYTAVVDRSMLTVASPLTPAIPGPKPWETKLLADASVGSPTVTIEGTMNGVNLQIFNDGVAVIYAPDTPGVGTPTLNPFRLGLGDKNAATPGDGEWIRVQTYTAGPPGSGTVIVTLDTTSDAVNYPGIQRFHGGSTRVSNTIPGNPGPQPLFDAGSPANRHLVPYFTRMDP